MPYLLFTLKLRFPSHCIVGIILAGLVPQFLALLVLFANVHCINYPLAALPDVRGCCASGIMSTDVARWGLHV